MNDAIGAALIAAFSSVTGSVLTFIVGIRSIRRSVSTSNGTPLGPALDGRLEGIELRLTRIEDSMSEVRERLAFEEGRSWPSLGRPGCLLEPHARPERAWIGGGRGGHRAGPGMARSSWRPLSSFR